MSRKAASQLAKELDSKTGNMAGRRIVVAGKGGVGKTTLSATLCLLGADGGRRVLALDQDVQQNLSYTLGMDHERALELRSIIQELDYVEEKVGTRPGEGWGGLMNLNPDVCDVVDRFGVDVCENLSLIVMGGVNQASSGCLCPENSLLGALIRHVDARDDDLIVMDAQAGLEPFGRSVAKGFSNVLVVAEPSFNSLQVAARVTGLAREMDIPYVDLVINKALDPVEIEMASEMIEFDMFDRIFALPFDPTVRENEPNMAGLITGGGPYVTAVSELMRILEDEP